MSIKRNTIQRQIILAALNGFKTHPSVDVIYSEVHKNHPTISRSTVYRNLNQLTKEGIVAQVAVKDDVARYDGCITPHYHCICNECGEITDVEMGYVEGLDNTIQNSYGFTVERHDISFLGKCSDCAS